MAGVFPFFENKGYHPAMTFRPEVEVVLMEVRELVLNLKENHSVLCAQIEEANNEYSRQVNKKKMTEPEFKTGDKVFLRSDFIRIIDRIRKLAEELIGLYRIIQKPKMHFYMLDLGRQLKGVHPVFHPL